MKSKTQKQTEALERIESKLKHECDNIMAIAYHYQAPDSPALRGLEYTQMWGYLVRANDIRRAMGLPHLTISQYELIRGKLVLMEGLNQFYPKEEQND